MNDEAKHVTSAMLIDPIMRNDADNARRRLAFLAEASLLLADSLDYDIVLAKIARLAVPFFTDWCIVDVVEKDLSIRRVAVAASLPEKLDLLHELQRRYPIIWNSPQPAAQALRKGKALLIADFPDDAALAATVRDETHFSIMKKLAPCSALAVPLVSRGHTLGVITFAQAESQRHYDDSDLALAEDLARRCAQAVDNSLLYRAAQEEIAERKRVEAILEESRRDLETRVVARTFELDQANQELLAEQQRSQDALRDSEDRFRSLIQSHPHPMLIYDWETTRILTANEAAVEKYGYPIDEFLGMSLMDLHPDEDIPSLLEHLASVPPVGKIGLWRHLKRDRTLIDVEIYGHYVVLGQRRVRFVMAIDVSERRKAEQALRESEERLRRFFEASFEGIVIHDQGVILDANLAAAEMYGTDPSSMIGKSVFEFAAPESRALIRSQIAARAENVYEVTGIRHDRTTFQNEIRSKQIPYRDREVRVTSLRDITQRKQLEDQLRQAQKMEAIGRLAGGIAHDFNNLLTGITGYGDILLEALGIAHPCRDHVKEIQKAADRAALLTNQLLVFSRKQVLAPQILDLNDVIRDMDPMLRRLIGEDVEFVTCLAPVLAPIRADMGQTQQVIVNLVVNARDAMPRGGKLVVETVDLERLDESLLKRESVAQGAFVRMTVRDTGHGMTADVLSHLFEPFFTTKEVGKGTGLGLSTIYGIVKQCGGFIEVVTEVDQGANFGIYFPATEGVRDPIPFEKPRPGAARGTETVLVVEDEDLVRTIVIRILRAQGYQVLHACQGADALLVAEQHPEEIHLLVTDVVMPEMSGRQVAEHLLTRRPEIRVLFISGYTEDDVLRHGVLESETAFLQKPFTPASLARKVREILDK